MTASTRRAALGAIFAAPLAAGAAQADGLDADLLDLERRHAEAVIAAEAASRRLDALDAAAVRPEPPEILFLQDGDDALGIASLAAERVCGRLWYPVGPTGDGWPQERLRRPQTRRQERPVRSEDKLPADALTVVERVPWPEAQARADAIVAAWDCHTAELAEVREGSGLNAAEAAWERLDDAVCAIEAEIRDRPARSLVGVQIKARLALLDLDRDVEPEPGLVEAIIRDVLALGGGGPA